MDIQILLTTMLQPQAEHQNNDREDNKNAGSGKSAGKVVALIQKIDVQREGIRLAPQMPGEHRHRTEFTHGAGLCRARCRIGAPT